MALETGRDAQQPIGMHPSDGGGAQETEEPAASSAEPQPLTTQEIVARCESSVARIQGTSGHGSGFLIKANVVVTNAHVVKRELMEDIRVHFPSAKEPHRGPLRVEKLLHEDSQRDLAFLSVRSLLPPLKIASEHEFTRGEDVVIIGSPGPLENAINRGVLSTSHEIRGQQWYQLGAPLNPGNSGGPVLGDTAEVVGVATLHMRGRESLSFCVPAPELKAALGQVPSDDSEAARRATSRHRAAVAFRRLHTLCNCYGCGLRVYEAYGKTAAEKNRPLAEAFQVARQYAKIKDVKVADLLDRATTRLMPGLESVVSRVNSDEFVEPRIKDSMTELWANCTETKHYWDRPRGTLEHISAKQIQLADQHKRLAESLKVLLDVHLN